MESTPRTPAPAAPAGTVTVAGIAVGPVACALGAAAVGVGVASVVPLLGALLVALALGVVVTNTRVGDAPYLHGHAAATRLLLRVGIVLLGLRLPLQDVLAVGPTALVVVPATVAATYGTTCWLGRRLGLDRDLVTLVATGFSICGAAAIAAVEDAVRPRPRAVALAVAMVTVMGTAMVGLVPLGAHLLGMSDEQAAIWAGASIHEVAQVVAAASVVGTGVVALATTVKLGRVVLLGPVYVLTARSRGGGAQGAPLVPWFVVGFALSVVARSSGLVPEALLTGADVATTLLLAAGMFGLGLAVRVRDLLPIEPAVVLLGVAATTVAAVVPAAILSMP
ncbi:MAG TPA: putative sulfate exporter family transporter [Nocardioides sp.]